MCRLLPLPGFALLVAGFLQGCAPVHPTAYWQDYMAEVRALGLMRMERAPEDAPVDARILAESFRKLGFNFEADPFARGQDLTETDMIRKWRDPIVYAILAEDGDYGPVEAAVVKFADRLGGMTGHSLTLADLSGDVTKSGDREVSAPQPNILFVALRDDALVATLSLRSFRAQGLLDEESEETVQFSEFLHDAIEPWYDAPSPCAGQVSVADGSEGTREGEILFAVVLLRPEVPPDLLTSCVEEELAQAMGLFNDELDVRPTIFNDDQEFALLTEHDAQLLRILYDPRLEIGMTPRHAMPIVRRIAKELRPDG